MGYELPWAFVRRTASIEPQGRKPRALDIPPIIALTLQPEPLAIR
jgi:hypothetical protein